MEFTPISALSPVDGRYRRATARLADYFSESALIEYRVRVEINYFIALVRAPLPRLAGIEEEKLKELRNIYLDFSLSDAGRIKEIEGVTNHDVKAVEYFLKEKFDELGLSEYKEFIHFALTSQDVNNTAVPLSLKESWQEVMEPELDSLIFTLAGLAEDWKSIPMLARTHGQPASPTRVGKEILVFVERLRRQKDLLKKIPFSAKFGGATGNFNAHHVAFPDIDWVAFGNLFVEDILGLTRSRVTTQIEPYDDLAAFFDGMKRINTIFLDLCRDMWTYISMEYFRQKIKKGEIGSSAMPHKVNPIDFENAEGNLGIANALFAHLSAKLPVSRLQRDLTDSTVLRNIGVPLGHTLIAFRSIARGLDKLLLNDARIRSDLEKNWAVTAEGIQTVLRAAGYPSPYEALLKLTRKNEAVDETAIQRFIRDLNVSDEIRDRLLDIRPETYTGVEKLL